MKIPSFKKMLCAGYGASPEGRGGKLVLLTAGGVIRGTHVDEPMEGDTVSRGINRKAFEEYQRDFRPESPIGGSDGCMMLSEVTLQTGGETLCLPELMVFYDQIIAVTVDPGQGS